MAKLIDLDGLKTFLGGVKEWVTSSIGDVLGPLEVNAVTDYTTNKKNIDAYVAKLESLGIDTSQPLLIPLKVITNSIGYNMTFAPGVGIMWTEGSSYLTMLYAKDPIRSTGYSPGLYVKTLYDGYPGAVPEVQIISAEDKLSSSKITWTTDSLVSETEIDAIFTE